MRLHNITVQGDSGEKMRLKQARDTFVADGACWITRLLQGVLLKNDRYESVMPMIILAQGDMVRIGQELVG